MSEQTNPAVNDAPAGAIPTPEDTPAVEQVKDEAGLMIGDPLPVGAQPAEEREEPPGMPERPDDLDRLIAGFAHETYLAFPLGRADKTVRPDAATVPDARAGRMHDHRPMTVRETLLAQIARQAETERYEAREWASAVRRRQEARDAFLAARQQREAAEDALYALGLDIEADHAVVEPAADLSIPDDVIV